MSEKKSTVLIKTLIILITICAGVANLVMPILSDLSKLYPNVPENIIIMANTMHYLTAIPTSILCAPICKKLGTKKTVLISMLLQGLGGAVPAIFSDYAMVLFSRAVFGVGWGVLMTIPLTLVGEYLPLSEQAGFIGVVMAVMALGASMFTTMGGALAGNMKVLWLAHLISAVFYIPVVLYFPKDRKTVTGNTVAEQTETDQKKKAKIPFAFYIILALKLILSGVVVQGMNLVSFFVEERGLGGTALAGSVLTVFQIASFAGGFLTGYSVKKMKKFTVLVCSLICGACYVAFAFSGNVAMLFISHVFLGLGSSIVNSLAYIHNSWVVPAESNDIVTGLTMGSGMLASFFLVYIPSFITQLLGYGNDYMAQYIVIGIVNVLVGIAHVVVFCTKGVKENVDRVLAESYGTAS